MLTNWNYSTYNRTAVILYIGIDRDRNPSFHGIYKRRLSAVIKRRGFREHLSKPTNILDRTSAPTSPRPNETSKLTVPLGFFAQARLGQRIPEEKRMNETQTIQESESMSSHTSVIGSGAEAVVERATHGQFGISLEDIIPSCPKCSSHRGQWRGYRQLKNSTASIHRRCCTTCGRWYGYKTSMR